MNLRFNIFNKFSSDYNLWKRNLFFVSIAQFVTMVGMSSAIPFLPLYIRDLGISDPDQAKLWSGIVFSGPYFLSIIFSPIWGTLGDKYGRKLMIIRALIGLSVSVFLMAFAQNVIQLFLLRVLQGAASGMVAAALAFVSANTPETRSGYAIGILQGSLSAGNIIGPFFGGIISDAFGIRPVFIIVSVLCLISALLIGVYVKEQINKSTQKSFSAIFNNIKFVKSRPEILQLMILIILTQAGIMFTNPIFPYFVEDLNAPKEYLSTITGVLIAIVGFFSIFFAPVWGKRNDKKDFRKTLRVASFVMGSALLLHLTAQNYLWLFPLRAVMGIFFAAMIPTIYSALSKKVKSDNKGGIMGLASSSTLFGSLISFLTCGLVTSQFGINSAFIFSGILLFSVTLYSYYKPN